MAARSWQPLVAEAAVVPTVKRVSLEVPAVFRPASVAPAVPAAKVGRAVAVAEVPAVTLLRSGT
jgi:hypothetical protein